MGPFQYYRLLRSANHAAVLTGAALLAALAWLLFRLPDGNVMLATSALMIAALIYDIRDFPGRLSVIFWTCLLAAGMQFLFSVLGGWKFAILAVPALYGYAVLRLLPNRGSACIVLLIGHLGLSATPGWYPGVMRGIDFIATFFALLAAAAFIPLIHAPRRWHDAWTGAFPPADALRISVLTAFGTYLMAATKMPEGIWIPLTVMFLYLRGTRGDMGGVILARIYGTFCGLLAGWLFLVLFAWFDFRTTYLLILLMGVGYFIQYYTGNYFVYTIFFMMGFCLYADILTPVNGALHFRELLCSRTLATAIGAFLTLIFEGLFLPNVRRPPAEVKA